MRAVLAAVVVCLALPASAVALNPPPRKGTGSYCSPSGESVTAASGPRVYWVTWKQAGRRLGPTLRFMRA